MELVAGDGDAFHLGFADFDTFLIGARVEYAFDLQTRRGRRRADQLDHSKPISKRPATPVLGDVAEQPMFDLVPLRCARRIVMNVDDETRLISELLQLELPQPHPRAV